MADLVEIEVKIHITDPADIIQRLEAAGAQRAGERVYEHNVRYENEDESFTPNGIVLRLRQDDRVRLTYKEPPADSDDLPDNVTTRFEAEVTVDDFDTMDVILDRLGFHAYIIYEKYRTTYRLGEAEIVVDELPYGHFIEVEGTADAINSTLVALGLQGRPRILGSYMELFTHVKNALGLTFHDLSFANFEGISVPPEIFWGPR